MRWRIGLYVLVAVVTSACSHYETGLKAGPVAQEFLPKFQVNGDVAVIGEHRTGPDKILLRKVGPHKWYVNTNEIVDMAVSVSKDILRQNNVEVNENANKVLKISFLEGFAEGGGLSGETLHATFRIEVQAGEDITIPFVGTQNMAVSFTMRWAIESATSYAAIEIFKNPTILEYLNE